MLATLVRVLFGRQAEAATVEGLIAGGRPSRSGVLVVRGEPGIGKSALLAHARERAREMRVLRATGIEAESELPFAALHQLVRPLLSSLDRLPKPQAEALAGAFGLSSASVEDRFLIGVGVLTLLADGAEETPLLCLIDDAQWLDRPSADALLFAARRLDAEPVVLLFASRSGGEPQLEAPGLPELTLGGLDPDAAAKLLAERAGDALAPAVRDRLVESSGGNPLGLVELSSLLSEGQLAGREPLPDPLPQGEEIGQAFLTGVRRLPPSTQTLLLLVAAEDTGGLATIVRAAGELGVDAGALADAEAENLVRVSDAGVEFRHPLIRSALYGAATFAERQTVHDALARVLDGEQDEDRRAWHLAAASLGQDEEVAAQLERAASRARRRSGFATAARALERAAELSADDEARGRRLATAAGDAWLAGRPDQAIALLDRAVGLITEPRVRAEATHIRGTIELRCGVPAQAATMLAAGAAEIASVAPAKAIEMLIEAGQSASYAGDGPQIVDFGHRAAALIEGDDPDQKFAVTVLVGIGSLFAGNPAEAIPRLKDALALAAGFEDPRRLVHAGACAGYLGDEATEYELYARAGSRAREAGAVATLPYVLEFLAAAEALNGRYAAATAHASEALRLAEETGQDNSVGHLRTSLALIAAVQGREDQCRTLAALALEEATARGLGYQAALAEWALARLDLGFGRSVEALARLEAVAAAGPGSGHPFVKLISTADRVEAAVHAGRTATAQTALADFERFAHETAPPWALALAARCRGLLSAGVAAERHFVEALRHHGASARPFDRARTELVFGEQLRRAGRRKEARVHLRAALDSLELLGAESWAERARIELRASGETARKRQPSTLDQLTPQEMQIVRFVAEGATNKEVAARLFLSPRTIDYHLRKVFRKLGVSSRAELMTGDFADATGVSGT